MMGSGGVFLSSEELRYRGSGGGGGTGGAGAGGIGGGYAGDGGDDGNATIYMYSSSSTVTDVVSSSAAMATGYGCRKVWMDSSAAMVMVCSAVANNMGEVSE